jgi:hypothetical protein
LADEVCQPAGAGDDDVDAAAEGSDLGAEADAAVHGGDAARAQRSERRELGCDLCRQLAGRREDECARALRLRALHARHERDAERDGLAGPGRRARAHVTAGEPVRDGAGLDGEGFGDPAAREARDEIRGHAEGGEGGRQRGLR